MTELGHEERFPAAKLNGGYRIRERSLANDDRRCRAFESGLARALTALDPANRSTGTLNGWR